MVKMTSASLIDPIRVVSGMPGIRLPTELCAEAFSFVPIHIARRMGILSARHPLTPDELHGQIRNIRLQMAEAQEAFRRQKEEAERTFNSQMAVFQGQLNQLNKKLERWEAAKRAAALPFAAGTSSNTAQASAHQQKSVAMALLSTSVTAVAVGQPTIAKEAFTFPAQLPELSSPAPSSFFWLKPGIKTVKWQWHPERSPNVAGSSDESLYHYKFQTELYISAILNQPEGNLLRIQVKTTRIGPYSSGDYATPGGGKDLVLVMLSGCIEMEVFSVEKSGLHQSDFKSHWLNLATANAGTTLLTGTVKQETTATLPPRKGLKRLVAKLRLNMVYQNPGKHSDPYSLSEEIVYWPLQPSK